MGPKISNYCNACAFTHCKSDKKYCPNFLYKTEKKIIDERMRIKVQNEKASHSKEE